MHTKSAEADFVETSVCVRYAETDKMGVVHYANYLVWFEVGRVAWCKARGFLPRVMRSFCILWIDPERAHAN